MNDQKKYHHLKVWQEAHKLALDIYKATNNFPREELFGSTSQIRRATLSVPTNIVEGQASHSQKDFINFLNIANRSLAETEYLLEFSRDIGYLDQSTYQSLEAQRAIVGKLLGAFIRKIKKDFNK